MKYDVIISEKAKQQLAIHISFIAKVNKESAVKTKNLIIERMRSLEKMPERYPFFDEDYIPKNKYHKMFVENWYIIIYQIRDNTVFIDYIIDCRQDYKWLIK